MKFFLFLFLHFLFSCVVFRFDGRFFIFSNFFSLYHNLFFCISVVRCNSCSFLSYCVFLCISKNFFTSFKFLFFFSFLLNFTMSMSQIFFSDKSKEISRNFFLTFSLSVAHIEFSNLLPVFRTLERKKFSKKDVVDCFVYDKISKKKYFFLSMKISVDKFADMF